MPFFARPDLSDEQFKQLKGSILTLSGQTRIATSTGFTLSNGSGGNIPVIATGGTNFDVLTYCNGKITLLPQTGGGGSIVYSGASPTTCSVGGLPSGSAIYGCTVTDILQTILVPTLYPTLTPPSSMFSINLGSISYEVGCSVSVVGTATFNRGCIAPAYCGGPDKRSGIAYCYEYTAWGTPLCSPNNTYSFAPHTITPGNNTISSRVFYCCGGQPLNSSGGTYSTPLPSGCTINSTISISGIYPYFYGKVASGGSPAGSNRPSSTAPLITGGTKVVGNSTGTICINFNSTSDDYIWFAIPNASTSKTKWYVNALNNGNIGGSVSAGGNLFPNPDSVINVSTTCWAGQTYKLYISNYQTQSTSIMELRNS